MLGAAGVNLGTRFIACKEAPAPEEWKQAIVTAKSEDIMKADVLNDISPLPGMAGFGTVARAIRTVFLDKWTAKREEARRERDRLLSEIISSIQAGQPQMTVPAAGQTAGVAEILGVVELMHRLVTEAEAALTQAEKLVAFYPAKSGVTGVR